MTYKVRMSIYNNLMDDMLAFHDESNAKEVEEFYEFYKGFHEDLTLEEFKEVYEDALRDLEREN